MNEASDNSVIWNPRDQGGRVLLAMECYDHPAVQPTSYGEVHELLGTSGCSPEAPYWGWEVLGVLTTPRGRLIVQPGDRIVQTGPESYWVIPEGYIA